MAANKVVYHNKVLIDLTGDTVTENTLIDGYTAHRADGTIITGKAFADYPSEWSFFNHIEDSLGKGVTDSFNNAINGAVVYRKM